MQYAKCPECKGKKKIFAIACPGFRPISFPCEFCNGRGRVSPKKIQWKKEGRKMWHDRVNRGLVLRKEAERRKMAPLKLSQMERGIIKPIKAKL